MALGHYLNNNYKEWKQIQGIKDREKSEIVTLDFEKPISLLEEEKNKQASSISRIKIKNTSVGSGKEINLSEQIPYCLAFL